MASHHLIVAGQRSGTSRQAELWLTGWLTPARGAADAAVSAEVRACAQLTLMLAGQAWTREVQA